MKTTNLILAITFTLITFTSAMADDKKPAAAKPSPRENLDTVIPEMIRLLEKKEYKTFIEQFAPPEELKMIIATIPIEKLAESFGKTNAERALHTVKLIKNKKPTFNEKKDEATYTFTEEEQKKTTRAKTVLSKIGKYWYIRN